MSKHNAATEEVRCKEAAVAGNVREVEVNGRSMEEVVVVVVIAAAVEARNEAEVVEAGNM